MKKLFFTIIMLFLAYNGAFSQNWFSVYKPEIINNGMGYSLHDQTYSIAGDDSGYVYITGFFEGQMVFGSDTLTAVSSRDIFVAKIDSLGNWIWASRASGPSAEYGTGIAVDTSGNIYITGYFYGSVELDDLIITSLGNSDAYLAKMNPDGSWNWAISFRGFGFNRGNGLDVDSEGNVYVTGHFEGDISFDSETSLTSTGFKDIFVVKVSSDGSIKWAKKAGGTMSDEAFAIKINSNDDILVGGTFNSTASFDNINVTSNGSQDLFVAMMDSDGNFVWVKRAGNSSVDIANSLEVTHDDNFVVTGRYENSITFGSTTLPNSGEWDVFLAKIDLNGNWIWAKGGNGDDYDEAYSLVCDSDGNIYLTGMFYDEINFGLTSLSSNGDRDMFLVKYDSLGNVSWSVAGSSESSVDGYGVVCTPGNQVIVTGPFYETATFGTHSVESVGFSDIYVGKISENGIWQWVEKSGGINGNLEITDLAIASNGDRVVTGLFYGRAVFGSDTLDSEGYSDIFVASVTSAGVWNWAVSFGGDNFDKSNAIDIDSEGNIYIGGYFYDRVQFGQSLKISKGLSDIFLLKLNPSGEIQWAESVGANGFDEINDIKASGTDIYLAGYFNSSPKFGFITISSSGQDDIFIAKIDSDKNWGWAKQAGGSKYDKAIALDVTSTAIYVTGSYEGTAYFGFGSISADDGDDIFIAKSDLNGTWKWSTSAGSMNWQERGNSIACGNEGKLWVGGTFKGVADFGGTLKVSQGGADAFISKLDTNGVFEFTQTFGGDEYDECTALAADADGNVTVGGVYSGSVQYSDSTFSPFGERDIFLMRINSDGDILWDLTAGGSSMDRLNVLRVESNGNTVAGGYYTDTCRFGQFPVKERIKLDRNGFLATASAQIGGKIWDFKENTGKSATVTIPKSIKPKIHVGGRNVSAGDAVGVFYTRNSNLYCAGYSVWNGSDMDITVWGDDANTLTKDGMADNEDYIFKIWDAINQTDYEVDAAYSSGNGKFADQALSVVSALPDSGLAHTLYLRQGWNLISTYIVPRGSSKMDTIMKDVKSNIVIMKNGSGQTYIPDFGLNFIGDWDIKDGYSLYMAAADTLKIIGDPVAPENNPVIMSPGWKIVSYLRDNEMDCIDALESITDRGNLVIAKNGAGSSYIPQFGLNMIGNMKPGEGYQLYLSATDTLIYPENSSNERALHEYRQDSKYKPEFSNTGRNMAILLQNEYIEDGISVGAFSGETCLGASIFTGGNAAVTVWGDNLMTEKADGARDFEEIEFRIIDYSGIEKVLDAFFISSLSGNQRTVFGENDFMIVNVTLKNGLKISPNPFTAEFLVEFPEYIESGTIEIYSSEGKLVRKISNVSGTSAVCSGSYVSGAYFIKVITEKGALDAKIIRK